MKPAVCGTAVIKKIHLIVYCHNIYEKVICTSKSLWDHSIPYFNFRQAGFGGGYDDRGVPSGRGGHDSDSDSELDIEGDGGPPSPDMSNEENNNSGDRGHESGGEDDPLTKPSGGLSGHTSWPAHPAFLPHPSPHLAAQTLSKITSQFWGFDRGPLMPPAAAAPHHPLDSLNFSFPLTFPGLNPMFKLPPVEADTRPMFRFKTS